MSFLTVLAAAAIGVAGCANGTADPTASPATPGTTESPAQVASCLIGTWRSTGVQRADNVSGGAGVEMTIAATGETGLNFTAMEPVQFAVRIGDTDVKGNFVYGGRVNSHVRTDSPTATSGTFGPVGEVDWGQLRVTAELTEPIKAEPLDNLPIGDYVGDLAEQTGNVVDVDPMLGDGRYACEGDTLTLTPQDDSGLKWTLTKQR